MSFRTCLLLSGLLLLFVQGVTVAESRLESEFKLAVPPEQQEAIWAYLNEAYGENGPMISTLGPGYSANFATDEFLDRYFDTPALTLLNMRSGLRHRTRHILEGADKTKDGRQLVQLKLAAGDSSGVVREEVKFKVRDNPEKVKEPHDTTPCVQLVKRRERPLLLERLKQISIEPEDLSQTVVLLQTRRRAYISYKGQPFATITLDHVLARSWLYIESFVEMELELNEIAYTDADDAARSHMTEINDLMKQNLFSRFPALKQDQTPKYNKAFDRLVKTDPFLRESLSWGFRPELLLLLPLAGLAVLVWRMLNRRRGRRKEKTA